MKIRRAAVITAVSIAALVAAYAAAGIWLAPKLLLERLPQYVERELGHKLELAALRIDPFRLSAEVDGARLTTRDGAPLASFARLHVDLELDSLWRPAWHFREISLAEPRVDLAVEGEGRLNWSAFVDALPKGQGGPSPQLSIERLVLQQGALAFTDRSREASAELLVQPIEIELLQIATASGERARSSIKAQLKGGGSLDWQGSLALEPLALEGRLVVDHMPVATAWRFADPAAKPPAGTLRAAAKISFRGDPRSLALEELSAKLEAFSLELANGASVSLGALTLAPSRYQVFAREGELSALQLESLRYAAPASGLEAKLARAETGAVSLQLGAQTIRVAQASLGGVALEAAPEQGAKRAGAALERAQLGTIEIALDERVLSLERLTLAAPRFEDAFDERGVLGAVRLAERLAPPKPGAAAQGSEPWRVELGALQASGGSVRLDDHRVSPAGRIDLGDISLKAGRLALPGGEPAEVSASLTLKPGAKIAMRGRVSLAPVAADLQLEAAGIALATAQPWLAPHMRLRLASGTLSAEGRLRAAAAPPKDGARLAFDGAVSIANLNLVEIENGAEFASLRALQTEALKLRIAPTSIEIDELGLLEPAAKLLIEADRSTNVANALGPQRKPAATGKTDAAQPGLEFAVNRVTVENAKLAFSDASLKPPFATRIHELSGVISGLSSDPGAAARLQLDGRVDEFGSARIRGTIDAKAPRTLTDVTLQFRNLPIEALNPYTAKFAGYRIESGRLAAELRYRVRDSQLKGENQLTIERLKLGERVQDLDAPNLPLGLAVALLTDLDGRMRLGIPVEGDLSNPQFDTAALVARAITSAIGKVVTAPFQLLAALLRRDVEELDRIDFDAGSAKLPPPEREKITSLAKALAERPQLALAVLAQFDRKTDAEALRALSVRRTLAQHMGIALRPGEDPGPPGLSDPRSAKAAEVFYAERFGAAALKEIKLPAPGAGQPADAKALARARTREMIERLTAQEPLAEGALEKLAQARAEAARAVLVEAGIDASRIVLGKTAPADASGDVVPTRLSVEVR